MANQIVMISTILLIIGSSAARQLIRLQTGKDCPMPGYFRDEFNCRKFYYCPSKVNWGLSMSEQNVLNDIRNMGLMCPQGSLFDEKVSHCESLDMIQVIPPECQESLQNLEPRPHFHTGIVPEISSNH